MQHKDFPLYCQKFLYIQYFQSTIETFSLKLYYSSRIQGMKYSKDADSRIFKIISKLQE